MIYQQLNTSDVAALLRADDNARWTADGAWALAEYLEELSEDCGLRLEFDQVAIRCEYSEYEMDELVEQYSQYFTGDDIIEEVDTFLDDLRDNTICVILLDNGNVLIQDF